MNADTPADTDRERIANAWWAGYGAAHPDTREDQP